MYHQAYGTYDGVRLQFIQTKKRIYDGWKLGGDAESIWIDKNGKLIKLISRSRLQKEPSMLFTS